ncbi:MAG: lipid A deacylase LpxR family protein [Pseudomonadota bacterium]
MIRYRLRGTLAALALCAFSPLPGLAEQSFWDGGALTLTFENDLFAVTDRNYSNGVKASYTAPANILPGFIDSGIDGLGLRRPGRDWYATYGIGQRIFTPTDITTATPDPTDHPYAGHAYLAFSLSSVTTTQLNTLRLEVGVTGEPSLAEETQKTVHSIVGADRPEGWGSQLPTAPTIGLTYEFVERRGQDFDLGEYGMVRLEVLPRATASLGTFDTYAGIGIGLRIGDGFANDFGAAHIRPGAIGSGVFIPQSGFGWSLFAGVDGRLIGRAGAIQGALFNGGGDVRPNRVVGDFSFGGTLSYDQFELTYAHVIRSETFRNQDGTHQFGAVNLRVLF